MKVGDGAEAGVTPGAADQHGGGRRRSSGCWPMRCGGAKVEVGGHRHALGGTFFEPTVVTGVTPDMAISREEIFGPGRR
jgi:succinate-semialdehyde dehydrogenase/glutarate-semialdehyde dehydrogenase